MDQLIADIALKVKVTKVLSKTKILRLEKVDKTKVTAQGLVLELSAKLSIFIPSI